MQMTDNEIVTSYQRTGYSPTQITILTQRNECGINHILCKKILCCVTAQQRTQIAKKPTKSYHES